MWLPNENAVELLSGTQSCVTTWHSLTLIFVVTVTPSVGVDSNHTKPSFFVASTLYGSKSSSTFCIFSLFKSCKARRIRSFAKLHISFQASALLRYQAWPKAKARPFLGLCADLYVPNIFWAFSGFHSTSCSVKAILLLVRAPLILNNVVPLVIGAMAITQRRLYPCCLDLV